MSEASPLANLFGAAERVSWSIHEQGFISKNLVFDVARHNDGFILTFKTTAEHWQIFFSPGGQVTHARHNGTPSMAEALLEHDQSDAVRPGNGAA